MSDHYADIMSGGDPSYWRGKLSSLADNEFVAELSDYVGRTARSIPSDDPNVYVGPSKFSGLLSLGFTGQGSPYWTGLIGSEKREEGERLGQFDPSTNEISIGIPSHASITEDKTKVYDPAIGKWVPIKEKARVLASRQKETIIHEGLHRSLNYIREHPELIPDWSYVHPETGKTITASDILDLGTGDSEYDEEHKLLYALSQIYKDRSEYPKKTSEGYEWKSLTPAVRGMYGSFANALDKKIREQQEWLNPQQQVGPERVPSFDNTGIYSDDPMFEPRQETLRHERWLREEWVPDASYQELFESGWIEEAQERAEKERRDKRSQQKWDAIRRARQYDAIAKRL